MHNSHQRMGSLVSLLLLVNLTACQPKPTTEANPPASTNHASVASPSPSTKITTPTANHTSQIASTVSPIASVQDVDVTESGIRSLTYGQTVTKADLQRAGFDYPSRLEPDPLCYYVPVGTPHTNNAWPASLLIMNNTLGSVAIQDNSISVFSGIQIGDSVTDVLAAHSQPPMYQVNKYDDGSGDQYLLIYTLPNHNQIKYFMRGGKKLPHITIAPSAWTAREKALLHGSVDGIEVGTPATIALVEGCS